MKRHRKQICLNGTWKFRTDPDGMGDVSPDIEQGRLDYRPFLSAEFPVADIGRAIDLLATREASKIFLRY